MSETPVRAGRSVLEPGTEVKGYRLTGLIGPQAGTGLVYEAVDTESEVEVAVKVVRAGGEREHLYREQVARFRGLDDAHVVEILGDGESEHGFFLVMALVRGTTLRSLMDFRELDPARAELILGQAAQGLGAAHRRGLFHADLKPANVLVANDPADHAVLGEFGVWDVAGTDPDEARSRDGAAYLSPEQLDGEPPTAAANVYSLAAIAFECLTGAVPEPSADGRLTAASQARPVLGDGLDEVFKRAMAPEPADRHPAPRDLMKALEHALDGGMARTLEPPLVAPPPSEASRTASRASAGPAAGDDLLARGRAFFSGKPAEGLSLRRPALPLRAGEHRQATEPGGGASNGAAARAEEAERARDDAIRRVEDAEARVAELTDAAQAATERAEAAEAARRGEAEAAREREQASPQAAERVAQAERERAHAEDRSAEAERARIEAESARVEAETRLSELEAERAGASSAELEALEGRVAEAERARGEATERAEAADTRIAATEQAVSAARERLAEIEASTQQELADAAARTRELTEKTAEATERAEAAERARAEEAARSAEATELARAAEADAARQRERAAEDAAEEVRAAERGREDAESRSTEAESAREQADAARAEAEGWRADFAAARAEAEAFDARIREADRARTEAMERAEALEARLAETQHAEAEAGSRLAELESNAERDRAETERRLTEVAEAAAESSKSAEAAEEARVEEARLRVAAEEHARKAEAEATRTRERSEAEVTRMREEADRRGEEAERRYEEVKALRSRAEDAPKEGDAGASGVPTADGTGVSNRAGQADLAQRSPSLAPHPAPAKRATGPDVVSERPRVQARPAASPSQAPGGATPAKSFASKLGKKGLAVAATGAASIGGALRERRRSRKRAKPGPLLPARRRLPAASRLPPARASREAVRGQGEGTPAPTGAPKELSRSSGSQPAAEAPREMRHEQARIAGAPSEQPSEPARREAATTGTQREPDPPPTAMARQAETSESPTVSASSEKRPEPPTTAGKPPTGRSAPAGRAQRDHSRARALLASSPLRLLALALVLVAAVAGAILGSAGSPRAGDAPAKSSATPAASADQEYLDRVNFQVLELDERRLATRRELAEAARPAQRQKLSRRLARQYGQALEGVDALTPPAGAERAEAEILAALRATRAAYLGLASAARRRDTAQQRYRGERIRLGELRLERGLERLADQT